MSRASLHSVLNHAMANDYAVPGMVCLGWEDMRAFVSAAEIENSPVILQAGPGCREHTPLPVLGAMFGHLADNSAIPVVIHLDHGYTHEDCKIAIESGFTSVMYDGSSKPLQQNIDETAAIVEMAHRADVSCEGEIGFVGYDNGAQSAGTDPKEAAQFAEASNVDALAISIGNVHLQRNSGDGLDVAALRAIEAITDCPLVIHGGSGVPLEQREHLSRNSSITKFNIGTELRSIFGESLRSVLSRDVDIFDRNGILKQVHEPLERAACGIFQSMGSSGKGSLLA